MKKHFVAGGLSGLLLASVAQAAIVIHYKLDETSGTVAADSAGFAGGTGADIQQDGSVINASGSGWTTGIIGGAYQFAGGDTNEVIYYNPGGVNTVNIGGFGTIVGLSMSMWIKTSAAPTAGATMNNVGVLDRNGVNVYSRAGLDSDGKFFTERRGQNVTDPNASRFVTSPSAVNDNQWHNVVATWLRDTTTPDFTKRLYVDGILVGSLNSSAHLTGNESSFVRNFWAGARRTGGDASAITEEFTGLMDDIGLYNEVLSAEKIALINAMGRFHAIDQSSTVLNNLLTVFTNQGGTETIGGYDWKYATGLSGVKGATGGALVDYSAYVVLDASGNGLKVVPEPGSLALLGLAGLALRRRK